MLRRVTYAALTLLSAAVTFAAVRGRAPVREEATPALNRLSDAVAAAEKGDELHELSLVYYGSSKCQWSNRAEVVAAIRAAIDSLTVRATRSGAKVSLIGVDIAPTRGRELEHMNRVARFDQVSLGGRYLNYIGQSLLGDHGSWRGETPQVLVLARTVQKESERGGALSVRPGEFRVLRREVGMDAIVKWVADGAAFEQ